MDDTLIDADIARRALGWRRGSPVRVEPRPNDFSPDAVQTKTPDAHVVATRGELVIQLDLASFSAAEARVYWEPGGVLHVWLVEGVDSSDRACHRRFDFAEAFDVRHARAWSSFGVLTIRVPRARRRTLANEPPITHGSAYDYAGSA